MTYALNHRDFAMQAFDQFLAENDIPRGKVLDVGCRDHCLKAALEERGFEWTGLDPYPLQSGIIKGNMEDFWKDPNAEPFDLIFACHSFEHCERPVDALREFQKALKPGGWVFLATPMVCEHHILRADPDHIFVLNPWQMARLMIYTGYELESIRSWVHPGDKEQNHTIVTIARKNA